MTRLATSVYDSSQRGDYLFQQDLKPAHFVFKGEDGSFSHSASHNNNQVAGLVAHEHNGYPQKYLAEKGSYYVGSCTNAEVGDSVYVSLINGSILTASQDAEVRSSYIRTDWHVTQGGRAGDNIIISC